MFTHSPQLPDRTLFSGGEKGVRQHPSVFLCVCSFVKTNDLLNIAPIFLVFLLLLLPPHVSSSLFTSHTTVVVPDAPLVLSFVYSHAHHSPSSSPESPGFLLT